MSTQRPYVWLLLILLAATFLRLHDITQIPPGMTHDEADHGLDAWGVVQGVRPIYFTVGYGREPLFDYSTAALMTFLGPTYLAGRLTAVFFSLLLIAGTYSWTRLAFDRHTALLTAAGLATGFWPLMSGRQALRSITLPALFVLATLFFWRALLQWQTRQNMLGGGRSPSVKPDARTRGLARFGNLGYITAGSARWLGRETGHSNKKSASNLQSLISNLQSPISNPQSPLSTLLPAALFLGLTFYTYIPSRILWLVFPALVVYLWLARREAPWRGTALMLLLAGLVGLPLFAYLLNNPQAEVRIGQLAGPLRTALEGDFAPLLGNAVNGLGIFTVQGDSQWRYNITGKPLLGPVMGLLFYAGVGIALFKSVACLLRRAERQCRHAPAHFFAFVWLLLGISPVLVTGAELSSTQAIGLQPVLYLFPALALAAAGQAVSQRWRPAGKVFPALALLLFALLFAQTTGDYFGRWANAPEVAAQYEAGLVELVRSLNDSGGGAVAISTDAPNRFHDPATAAMYLENEAVTLHWFDGRHSLLLPEGESVRLYFTPEAPLHSALQPYFQALSTTLLSTGNSTGNSPGTGVTGYRLSHNLSTFESLYPQFFPENGDLSTKLSTNIAFGHTVRLVGYHLTEQPWAPGDTVQVITAWQVRQQSPEELVLFTHLLGADGAPVAQVDRLDVPSLSWKQGDIFVQLHEMILPSDLTPGTYPLTTGFYHAADWQQRLPLTVDGASQGDALRLATVTVE